MNPQKANFSDSYRKGTIADWLRIASAKFIYKLVLMVALFPIAARYLLRPAYRDRFAERLFLQPRAEKKKLCSTVWIHAVSLGEVNAALPLIKALLAQQSGQILITTTTATGSLQVTKKFSNEPRVVHAYIPFDYGFILQRFISAVKPTLVILMERELWPNLIMACRQYGAYLVLVNGRLTERAQQRYALFTLWIKKLLNVFDLFLVQTKRDYDIFAALGADTARIAITGNLKFDLAIDPMLIVNRQAHLKKESRPILIAASTHAKEEAIILNVFANLRLKLPTLLLVLVPRHPERFDEVADLCQKMLPAFSLVRRTACNTLPGHDVAIYLADTMGELLSLYAVSDVAFVGGSLVPVGGHNLLEPIALHVPVITGHHCFNSAETFTTLQAGRAILVANDAASLEAHCYRLLTETAARDRQAATAATFYQQHVGATERVMAALHDLDCCDVKIPPDGAGDC